MKIERRFTTEETGAYGALGFRTTAPRIRNPDGSVVFSLDNLEVPEGGARSPPTCWRRSTFARPASPPP